MAMRVSEVERTPEFSLSVIFTTSESCAVGAEVLILLFIVLVSEMIEKLVQLVLSRPLQRKYIPKVLIDDTSATSWHKIALKWGIKR